MYAIERWDVAQPRRMSPKEDMVTLALAGWLVFGIFLDGWAHHTGTLV